MKEYTISFFNKDGIVTEEYVDLFMNRDSAACFAYIYTITHDDALCYVLKETNNLTNDE